MIIYNRSQQYALHSYSSKSNLCLVMSCQATSARQKSLLKRLKGGFFLGFWIGLLKKFFKMRDKDINLFFELVDSGHVYCSLKYKFEKTNK